MVLTEVSPEPVDRVFVSKMNMRRAMRVGVALVTIISVAVVLITPATADDVDGILHRHHSPVFTAIVGSALQGLNSTLRSSAEGLCLSDLPVDLLNRFFVRLC
jgi:hypothetical protein